MLEVITTKEYFIILLGDANIAAYFCVISIRANLPRNRSKLLSSLSSRFLFVLMQQPRLKKDYLFKNYVL